MSKGAEGLIPQRPLTREKESFVFRRKKMQLSETVMAMHVHMQGRIAIRPYD